MNLPGMRRLPCLPIVLSGSLLLAACGGDREIRCSTSVAYLDARTAAQLRIPDDLSVPNEIESLRIPEVPPDAEVADQEQGACLDASPALIEND